jgi:hypothetical protein
MTEDLHNDIDDLFRSGLEGKEDTPSPDVWAAIAKGLPTPPPPVTPSPSAPAASGGWASSIIVKGIIGAVVLAIAGTVVLFVASQKDEPAEPEIPSSNTETTGKTQPSNTPEKTNSSPERISTDRETYLPQVEPSGTANPSGEQSTSGTTEVTVPPVSTPDQKPTAEKISSRKNSSANTGIPKSGVNAAPGSEKATKPVSHLQETPSIVAENGTDPVKREATNAPNAGIASSGKRSEAPLTINRNRSETATPAAISKGGSNLAGNDLGSGCPPAAMSTVNGDAGPKSRPTIMPAAIPRGLAWKTPSFSLPSSAVRASSGEPLAAGGKGTAPLKRNNWTSKVFLTPLISLNMTRMDVEENREYGPRLGREHIEFRETEESRTTLSPGLLAGFAVTPSIWVQTGISELRNDISVSAKDIRAVRDRDGKIRYRLDCSSGSYYIEPKAGTNPSVGDSLRIASSEIRMRYASIPLSVRINFGSDRLLFFASAGGDMNILTGKRTSTSLTPSSSEKVNPIRSEGTRKQYVSGSLGVGVEIKAGKRLGIMLMPQYRFPLGIMNEEGPVKTYPKTFSVTSGVRIGF